ncbi:MAG: hypothetical protein Kow00108_19700 [Calditrichia bacterium]
MKTLLYVDELVRSDGKKLLLKIYDACKDQNNIIDLKELSLAIGTVGVLPRLSLGLIPVALLMKKLKKNRNMKIDQNKVIKVDDFLLERPKQYRSGNNDGLFDGLHHIFSDYLNLSILQLGVVQEDSKNILMDILKKRNSEHLSSVSNDVKKVLKEVLQNIKCNIEYCHPDSKKLLIELIQLLENESILKRPISLQGRLIAEKNVDILCNIWNSIIEQQHKFRSLNEQLKFIQDKIIKHKPWIFSYYKLLQSCGNQMTHNNDIFISDFDLVSICIGSLEISKYSYQVAGAS